MNARRMAGTRILTALLAIASLGHADAFAQSASGPAGPVTSWPRPIPGRVLSPTQDAQTSVAAFVLGDLRPPLANATFDPSTDTLALDAGGRTAAYFRDVLGVRFFEPLNTEDHPSPPSGWCSWYYFYQEVSADDILSNARWAADHLADYGLRYIQIDDGWQGKGRGLGDNRDWFTTDARFRRLGMDGLAQEIRRLGFEAGIWLVPYGQSNTESIPDPDMILRDAAGDPVRHEWLGDLILDPTHPSTETYLSELFGALRQTGYTYFKTDGFPPAVSVYADHLERLHAPPADLADREHAARLAFRDALGAVRPAIGDESYWLGCWGVELAPVGMVNGGRTAGDVRVTREGYAYARAAILRWAFLHNIAWISDPDVLLVRPPLPEAVARSWTTALGVSGQAVLLSDDLPNLPESRVELLRRVLPATDVRSIDLYRPENVDKPIWSLTSHRPDAPRSVYSVVAVFNGSQHDSDSRLVAWSELGLPGDAKHHIFDFWRGEYLGAWEHGVFLTIPPGDVRLLAVAEKRDDAPVLLSTNRHITQGWVDLVSMRSAASDDGWIIRGRSRVVQGDHYELAFGLPSGDAALTLVSFSATDEQRGSALVTGITHQHGAAIASVEPARSGAIDWVAEFAPSDALPSHPVAAERDITIEFLDATTARIEYQIEWIPSAGYLITLDDEPLGTAFDTHVILRDLEPGRSYTVSQRPVWYDGTIATNATSRRFTVPRPGESR